MTKRIIVHAGFHKTGTTTIQKTLRKNRAVLKPYARVILRAGMLPLCEAARAWSVSRSEWDMGLVKYEAAQLAEGFADDETVMLSSEDLSGHMPGRRGLKTYDAAPRLMAALEFAFHAAIPNADVTFVFSTRTADPWLASCHVQHVRATRMVLSRKDYVRKYRKSADLGAVIDAVSQRVPNAKIVSFPLEVQGTQIGPVAPLLELVGVPQDVQQKMITIPPANTSPSDAKLHKLLELNRSDMDETALKVAKRALNDMS